jgi:hypothetical protein
VTAAPVSDIERIRAGGWTQGSVLLGDAESTEAGLEDNVRYLVISHPCDVVSLSLERDPIVEVLRIEDRGTVDGNFTHGKNPRRLHLATSAGVIAVDFVGRAAVDRTVLASRSPNSNLTEDERRLLAAWLSARYARPAFADEFNRRLAPASRGIERVLKAAGKHMSGIYVATSLAELDAEDEYQVRIVVTMRSGDYAEAGLFAVASKGVDDLEDLVKPLAGIDLVSVELYSEDRVSVDALRTFARWDYDSLSFKEGDEAVFPAPL